jgi:hypothetical protein
MGMVFVFCPAAKEMVPTGIGMDKQSYESASLTKNSFRCPACGQMHEWDKENSLLGKD